MTFDRNQVHNLNLFQLIYIQILIYMCLVYSNYILICIHPWEYAEYIIIQLDIYCCQSIEYHCIYEEFEVLILIY